MSVMEAVPDRPGPAARQWSIAAKTTLLVVPVVVMTLVLGVVLVWVLATGDPASGFSGVDALAITVVAVIALAALGTILVAYRMGRSMARRVDGVSAAARRVAHHDLVDVLDALRTPDPDLAAVAPLHLDDESGDEIGDLARSFRELHQSMIEIASSQMESLRMGVSSIFVTLARRNSGLVDRQLALLDKLESREQDPDTLAGYFQIDHLAARMRRNAESLLVLAGAESPRIWAKATEMSVVVRAAVSEVDEYQRVALLALEPARLAGSAVTDMAHLLAELLENAVQFSPPSEPVRVTGLFGPDGYEVSITDRGVGMSDPRVAELNRILERPPALGLSVEPTMGIYVVARLAQRHGLTVRLLRGVPGISARVSVPRDRLEVQSAVPEDEVIDLTEPELTDGEPVVEPETDEGLPLPVRAPGRAFQEEDQTQSVTVAEGGALESALVAYDQGRRAAEEDDDE